MRNMKKNSKTILSQVIALGIVILLLVASRFYDEEIKQNNLTTERNKKLEESKSILSSSSVEKVEWQNGICSMEGTFKTENNNCEHDEIKGNTNNTKEEVDSYLEKKLEIMISVEEKEKKKKHAASWFDRIAESYNIFTQYNKILLFLFCLPLVPNPFKGKIISVTLYVEDFDFSSLLEEIDTF